MSALGTAVRPRAGSRLLRAAARFTTPLLPDDYLTLINPLWTTRELRGRVERVIPETRDSATLVIRPGLGWSRHQPGQYVGVGLAIDGVHRWRTYSLTSVPDAGDGCIWITVKALPDGFVSRRLVFETPVGTVLRLAAPQGRFVLPESLPERILFLTGGSGLTPVMGMLRSLLASTPPGQPAADIVVVHSAPTPDDVIFAEELRGLPEALPGVVLHERHTDLHGVLAFGELDALCPDWRDREVWACGPGPMLDDAERHWDSAGLAQRLHLERFRPPTLAGTGGEGGTVRFSGSDREVEADGDTPLLDVGESAGVLMPSGCRMGICFGCVAPLRTGRVRDLRNGTVTADEGALIQTCVSAAAGPVEIDL
jgi:stearoyl-CoA 9-desaturase NADPH oxidoreductase